MDEDRLAEVIHEAGMTELRSDSVVVAAAIRAHIAAVLDAEEAKWTHNEPISVPSSIVAHGALDAVASLRAALLGTTEGANGG